ncbi:MAG: leucine-rich repeat protein [Bacteroidales bacterium]|jgi:hypothetical protein|nr:leucine-rich repeat protein [Bacteroidales bacterium]
MKRFMTIALFLCGLNATNVKSQTVIASGTSGILNWQVTSDSLLTINGTGAMLNYTWNSKPWYAHKDIITHAIVEDGVTTIGNGAFSRLNKLEKIDLPNTITSIGDGVFTHCSLLKTITIPEIVTSIGNYVFTNCALLTTINVNAIIPPIISSTTFDGVALNIHVYVPCGSFALYQSNSSWSVFTNLQEKIDCNLDSLTNDTVYIHDTVYIYDTIYIHDTTYITIYDTVYIDTCNNSINKTVIDENKVTIYPNPTKNILNIEFEEYLQGSILLYDINNRAVLNKEINVKQNIIDMRFLPKGIYMLQIISSNGKFIGGKKIVKQ